MSSPPEPVNPCTPSPCGPNSQCQVTNDSPSCSCLPEFLGSPPNCRPECTSNSECPNNLACINRKCQDPCPNSCAPNAQCRVVSHTPTCVCPPGYSGDPFTYCSLSIGKAFFDELHWKLQTKLLLILISTFHLFRFCVAPNPTPVNPCVPSPCGANAECKVQQNAGSCACLLDYIGNPYEGCRPECTRNTDCPSNLACIGQKCKNPCPGTCGQNAECYVQNHSPVCVCFDRYSGDPFRNCQPIPPPRKKNASTNPKATNTKQIFANKKFDIFTESDLSVLSPCRLTQCGPYSQCREVNGQAVCSCLPEYTGVPPLCKPECTTNSECPLNRACINQKCVDPCINRCGEQAVCRVVNHSPICTCKDKLTGDPFSRCYFLERKNHDLSSIRYLIFFQSNLSIHYFLETPPPQPNPCIPSPCGPNSLCQINNGLASCSCGTNYYGTPPYCRPECTINSDCTSNKACINERCIDPCLGSCGLNALCNVYNHVPACNCLEGYTGDPFTGCQYQPRKLTTLVNKRLKSLIFFLLKFITHN